MSKSMAIVNLMEEETKTIKDAFNEMCAWRLEHRSREHITEKYEEVSNRNSKIFKELLAALPEDKKKLLYEYETSISYLQCLDEDTIYKLGLNDGKELLSLF